MVYQIAVDGKEKIVEARMYEYSLETDNNIRKRIVGFYLNERGAEHVEVLTSSETVRMYQEKAKGFYAESEKYLRYINTMGRFNESKAGGLLKIMLTLHILAIDLMDLVELGYSEDEKDDPAYEMMKELIWKESGYEGPLDIPERFEFFKTSFLPYPFCNREEVQFDDICTYSLSDSLADICTGLFKGMIAYRLGYAVAAVSSWKINWGHWGQHLVTTIQAMSQVYSNYKENIEKDVIVGSYNFSQWELEDKEHPDFGMEQR